MSHSISSGTFPGHWEVARVTPLFKGGGASDRSSYRPISILPILSKLKGIFTMLCIDILLNIV